MIVEFRDVLLSNPFSTKLFLDDLNHDLVDLQNWLHGNKLSLNVVKTHSLIIGSRPNIQKIRKFNLRTDTKYLRVQIDDKLQWDRHIEHVKAKALCELSVLLSMPRNFFHQVICRKCIEEFLSHISDIAVRFEVVVLKLNSVLSKRSRIELHDCN